MGTQRGKMDTMHYYGTVVAVPDIDPQNFENVRDALLGSGAADGRVAGTPQHEYYKPPEINLNPGLLQCLAAFTIDERMAA